MNTRKFKPTAFLSDSMIWVVYACLAVSHEDSLSRFEVFKPVNDDGTGGTWTPLEDPPFGRTLFTGHAVVNRQDSNVSERQISRYIFRCQTKKQRSSRYASTQPISYISIGLQTPKITWV